ncbi:hypothetical protein BSKO_13151 [Bryopsis sp. KO-2023]|nr:hypothetical protein BSKO_13151 [Bryopsis sp. KO-2023]
MGAAGSKKGGDDLETHSVRPEQFERLISLPESKYTPPVTPFDGSDELEEAGVDGELQFGESCRELFLIDFDKWTFFSHGAFGAVLKPAYLNAEKWRRLCEAQPLKFWDRELLPLLGHVIREMASFISCPPQNLVLVPNATTGLNAAIKSISLTPEDAVFVLNVGYKSVKKIATVVCEATGADLVIGDIIQPPRSADDIIFVVENTLPSNAKLAIFDVVTSNTAMKLPVGELIALCKKRGIPVLLDGAHALGMMPVNISQWDPDFFVGNCHKWLCSCKGCAVLYVADKHKHQVQPLVTSGTSVLGFPADFAWDGNRDYSPYLSLPCVLKFWEAVGSERAAKYIEETLAAGVQILIDAWGTDCLVPGPLQCPSMAMVRLRDEVADPADPKAIEHVQDTLHHKFQIEVPVKLAWGKLYVRVSVPIYTRIRDFEDLAEAVCIMAQQKS